MRFLVAGAGSGLLFGVLDGILNANPLAQRLFAVYRPIARPSVDALAGAGIDLVYGFIMAALFLLLRSSLPGGPLVQGIVFGLIAWFFRVLMGTLGQWTMFVVPGATVAYSVAAGMVEMVLIGLYYGAVLRPPAQRPLKG